MLKLAYNKNNYLLDDSQNYIIFKNGEIIDSAYQQDIEISQIESYSLHNIYEKEYSEVEKNIILNAPFVTLLNINKSNDLINLKIINTSDEDYYSNIVINILDEAKVHILDIAFENKQTNNTLLEVICNKNANVKYTKIESSANIINNHVNFYIDENVHTEINTLSLNDSNVNNKTNVYMHKSFSKLVVNNAIINNSSLAQSYDYNVYHVNKNSQSQLTNYAICKDNSTLNINSNGIIKKDCSKSKIIQKSKGVILDLVSAISANPLLQIDEYDVEANHGASIGAIDDEDLYYLMSRGLTKSQSEHLIVSGYMNPIMSKIEDDKIKEYAQYLIDNKLK